MEEWVHRALKRWPNVPALYDWLSLDRRGRWLIKDETITRPQIIEVINRNYAADERGCWYFQNGPQRGYMQLQRAPFIAHIEPKIGIVTHTGLPIERIDAAFLDENGGLYFETEHGPAALLDTDLDWALANMRSGKRPLVESDIAQALSLPSGTRTDISMHIGERVRLLERLDDKDAPRRLRFTLEPKPN